MHAFRRFTLLLALSLPAFSALPAQNSGTSSSAAQDQTQSASQAQSAGETAAQLSVQERIRQRRLQRRATAIHDAYDHRWETYMDMGYLRFQPGPSLQRLTYYAWETGLTRFSNERLGFTLDGRGYYGTAYVGLNQYSQGNFTRPAISQYDVMAGPVYRFYLQPKYSISGRVMAGWAHGNFSGDTNGISPPLLGLYPDADTYAASAAIIGEYNLTPSVGFKLAPEYFFTGFGSTTQASRGFTAGVVYRFGKQ
jgi:hypothetical protein